MTDFRDTPWEQTFVLPWRKIEFIDGTAERGVLVAYRRYVGGKAQYRRLTQRETNARVEEEW